MHGDLVSAVIHLQITILNQAQIQVFTMRLVGHVEHTIRCVYIVFWWESQKVGDLQEDLDMCGRIMTPTVMYIQPLSIKFRD
jgi:hypothetical protein